VTRNGSTERPRRPKQARTPLDVLRHRGLIAGAIAAGALLVAVTLLAGGRHALVPRGQPALPHEKLECGACHEPARAVTSTESAAHAAAGTTAACVACHGEHVSRRAAHRALSERGELACGTCHAVHEAEDGLRFSPDGSVAHYGAGFVHELAAPPAFGIASAAFVPLIDSARCATCHDLSEVSDPAASCFSSAHPRHNLCFDEHRAPVETGRAGRPARDALRERSRTLVLAGYAERTGAAGSARAGLALGASLLSVFLLAFVARARRSKARAVHGEPRRGAAFGRRRLPQIDPLRCLGCHACVDACPYDVLEVERYVARVARPDDCCGLVTCEAVCPNGSLVVLEGPPVASAPEIGDDLQLDARPGVYLAGDASGSSLIRNAVRQGVAVARSVHQAIQRERANQRDASGAASAFDLAVVGAGPAGLSAGLEAKRLGLSVLIIEQATLAESIRRFSRHKLVLDADSEADDREGLPLYVGETHKEELLWRWQRSVRQAHLDVREDERVTAVEGERGAFRLHTLTGAGLRDVVLARRTLIAVGRRGTPRKLELAIPEVAQVRVHYELSDAQAFASQRVVVIGLGDVAMESALALAAQPGTEVTLIHRGKSFRRGKRRNIEALTTLVARGRVRLEFESEIVAIGLRTLEISVRGARCHLDYDALFVMIGTLPAGELLSANTRARSN
jgi:thioredoxin reductase/NAD-dependent dihydropyrimidine dehydrogenase PreA subunit